MQQLEVLSFCGSWSGISAGGSFEYASWRYNPQLFVKAQKPCSIKILLSQERQAVSGRFVSSLADRRAGRSCSRLGCTWPGLMAAGTA